MIRSTYPTVSALKEFRRRERTTVTAVRLDLDTDGFAYQKWGGAQRCKRGDWLVDNGGDTNTIDAESFARTYRRVSPGVYEKTGSVWAKQATSSGTMRTKEGSTNYERGDWLVFNDPSGADGYAVSANTFQKIYEPTA